VEEPPGPAVPDLSLFSLFPTVEEQIENIAQAQSEDRQTAQQQLSIPAEATVPEADIGRALTSGGNNAHSIERIVAFFQKSPTGSAAASFMEKEFGEGGKGVKIAGQDYAIWFDQRGFRIAPGRSAFGPGSTLVTWVNAAVMVRKLLRDGMFATQDKIDAAPDNEVRELAEKLWYLRQDFSDSAKERNLLPTVSEHFFGKGFPDDTKEIAELLKDPTSCQQIVRELGKFLEGYKRDQDLLRFKRLHQPQELFAGVAGLFSNNEPFQAAEGFAAVRASFITEDEITRLLARGPNISESKLQIYSYIVQGHNAKECADFLKRSYGDGGHSHIGYDEWHDSKGIRLTRSDDFSGKYDTVSMNWNQVQKRIRALIDGGQYLNEQEKAHLPAYDKLALARKIYAFNYYKPDPNRTYPHDWDPDAAKRDILPLLDDPEQVEKIFNQMLSDFVPLSPDTPHYTQMQFAIRDVGMYQRGESPLFTPLPESALEEERQVLRREKEGKRAASEPQRTTSGAQRTTSEAPPAPGDRLAAAARALVKKRPAVVQETQDGQFSLFSSGQTAEPQEQREITDEDLDHFLIDDLGDPERKQRIYALFAEGRSDEAIVHSLEQEYSRSRHGNLEGGFCTLADGSRGYAYFTKELRISPRPEGKMRHVSFEEMAAHIRRLIQENRYLPPEKLAQYQKGHEASEPETFKRDEYTLIKEANPDSIVLYQVNDRFELYGEDAKAAVAALELKPTALVPDTSRVERCDVSVDGWEPYVEKLRETRSVTLASIDAQTGERRVSTMQPLTVREIYERYVPTVKGMVLADKAYQNACVNSDRENAYLEGNEAVKRAVLAMTVPAFTKQYYDNARFSRRLHQEVLNETYPLLSLSQQEKAEEVTQADVTVAPVSEETTVAAEEAPLLARLLRSNGIDAAQFVHDSGDVTFSFDASDRDAVENLIATLRAELAKAVEATYPSNESQKPGRTKVELNYRNFAKLFPEVASGEYRYLRMEADEAGAGMMPLHLEWIDTDVIAVSHTYTMNGDLMRDPEMTFRVDQEKGTLEPLTFRQDGSIQLYQEVYPEPGRWIPKLRRDLNTFAQQWLNNISQQNYHKREATVVRDGEDVRLTFDQDGRAGEPEPPVPPAGSLSPEQPEAGVETPPAPERVPEPTGAGVPEQAEKADTAAAEPDLTPNVDEYLNLKAQHPDKLIGVQVGGYMLFYGKDAEAAAPAMGTNLLTRDISGLGTTAVTGSNTAWQATLKKLLEHGQSVVLARPDPERGPDAPYEIIKERSAADYIPLGMELTIGGRRMKIDSVAFDSGTVSLRDMDLKGWFPVFRVEPISFVRQFVEEVQRSEERIAAEMADQLRRDEAAAEAPEPAEPALPKGISNEIPVGMVLTIDGHRMKIDSVDKAGNDVMLLDLDTKGGPPMFIVRPAPYVRRLMAEAQTADTPSEPELPDGDADLETAKQLIRDFCAVEYQIEEVDFSNPEHIGLAYTTTEDEQHEIQVEVDLLHFSVSQLVDDVCVEKRSYDSLRDLIDSELTDLDFDELVRLEYDIPPELEQPERAEPIEQVELDGGKIIPPRTPVTTEVVGRYDAGSFDIVVEKMHFGPEKHNFHITDDNLGVGGEKTKYQYNVTAIRTLKQIEGSGRLATPEEQEILSRYVGWGGIAKAFDPDDPKWAKEYAELKELLTPTEYESARSTVLNAHYARFVP